LYQGIVGKYLGGCRVCLQNKNDDYSEGDLQPLIGMVLPEKQMDDQYGWIRKHNRYTSTFTSLLKKVGGSMQLKIECDDEFHHAMSSSVTLSGGKPYTWC